MANTYFPVSGEVSERMPISGPLFRTSRMKDLYLEAQRIASLLNARAEGAEESITPGHLISLHVLRIAKLDVIAAIDRQRRGAVTHQSAGQLAEIPGGIEAAAEELDSCYPFRLPPVPGFSAERTVSELGWLAVESRNPALAGNPYRALYGFHHILAAGRLHPAADAVTKVFLAAEFPDEEYPDLFSFLDAPARHAPGSIEKQLDFIMQRWSRYLSSFARGLALRAADVIREEQRPQFPPGPGPAEVPDFSSAAHEYEAFSQDSDWMPNVVMLAKSTLVWLDQLSRVYGRKISRLDQIPDEELDLLAERGFNTLWLIGLWERSQASKLIKQMTGNPEAEASAYSLHNYDIAGSLGGWAALEGLRGRCARRGIRLASDMVPNHTGIDSAWVLEQPELFLQTSDPPFPGYTYSGRNLSPRPETGIYIEDHYYDRTDAAVTFKRVDHRTGAAAYIYHGNDGTSMPWNDTAQLDYLNPKTRETVIRTIIHVARSFPVIRFDAAMTLARKHIQRLWYPTPGSGGDIPSRSACGMEQADFNQALPVEFWREVVDRIAEEAPDTLLLAEAFWMMEGYFVRTLGMHRVYNSAFMNMLKMEENRKYRDTIKNTLTFDPEILKRFVNFMNNPDEETAIEQFGNGDKYFGVCTLLVTMPGLPMIGHGQVEGYREKYGMEFSRAYWEERPDEMLVKAHAARIFPLMRRRYLFSGSRYFALYDVIGELGVQESIFAYTNGTDRERVLVLYNNTYQEGGGWIRNSAPFLKRIAEDDRRMATVSLGEALHLTPRGDCFCVMRGFHDGLTYLRRSSAVHEQGLYLFLKGYETQVFLDIREVEDNEGLYGRLCEQLDGRGTPNLELALQRIRLQSVHTAALPLVSTEATALTAEILSGKDAGAASAAENLTRLLIGGWQNLAAAWQATSFPEGSPLNGSRYRPSRELAESAVSHLAALGRAARSRECAVQRCLANTLLLMPEIPAILCGRLFCLPIRFPWQLGDADTVPEAVGFDSEAGAIGNRLLCGPELLMHELLHDRLYEAGIHLNDAYRAAGAVDLMILHAHWFRDMVDSQKDSVEELAGFTASAPLRSFARFNWHEGVEWYHKEALQEAFSWLFITAAFSEPRLLNDRESRLHRTVMDWMMREAGAGYRVGSLSSR